jgi:tetratricopeptide (TPR) repeat protein
VAWVAIAIALSFIVEIVKRFLTGGVDVASTVVQGLVALLVGGSAVQFARQLVGLKDSSSTVESTGKIKFLSAAILILVAIGLQAALPKIAGYYSDQGVIEKKAGRITSAIESYERSVSLKPDDALAHYNLGLAYEAVLERDKAESEYVAALRWDNKMCFAYNRLAQLQITRHKDFATALSLLNTAIEKLGDFGNESALDDDARRRIQYSLLENRGWAQLGLKHPLLAQPDLVRAQQLRPDAPGAHCLLGDVLSELKQSRAAEGEWEKCIAQARAIDNENEAELISDAAERIGRNVPTSESKVTHK